MEGSQHLYQLVGFLLQRNLEAIVLMSGFVHIPNDDGLLYIVFVEHGPRLKMCVS